MALVNRQPDLLRGPARRFRAVPAVPVLVLVLVLLTAPGCSNLSAWRVSRDSSLSKPPTQEELQDDRSLMARWLSPRPGPYTGASGAPRSSLVLGSNGWQPMKVTPNPEADKEIQAAEQLFQQGKLEEAEAAFARIAKNREKSPWGEKAQFYVGECQYQRGRYVKAHDSFETLASVYPGTMYMDKVVSREFAIAETWLAQDDPKTKPEKKIPWTGHFDGRLPLIDTSGHALQVLEHVRQHEPEGPLADDAVMRIADQHYKSGSYEVAAIHYDQLATDHPKSPFLQRAQLQSIDSRIKDYIGPEYDASGLEKARELIKQTMLTFPDRPEGNEKLYNTLALINDQDAERTYLIGDYYRRAGKVASAEFYFGKVRSMWPKSPWAVKAKSQLAVLAKMPRTQTLPSRIMMTPGAMDASGASSGGGMNGMGMGGMGMGGMGMGGMGMGGMGNMGGMY
jgi:TolA-binding protein